MQSQKTENYAKADIKAPLHHPAPPDPATMPDTPPTTPPPKKKADPNIPPAHSPSRPPDLPLRANYPPTLNENARTASFAPLWYLYDKLWTDLTPCSGVPIVDSKTSN